MHTRAVVLVQRERLCYSKKRCVSAAETCRHSGKPKCTCTAEERIIRGMKKDNIVLIGMPGVGKSTAGVILAKVLGYEFVDADLVIQKEEGKLLKEIIEEVGTDGFIAVENRVNSSLEVDHSIIATGGSVVYGKEAMEHLKSIGTVVYLQLPFEELNRRLSDIKGRGVVLKDGQTLKDLYEERVPLYEKYADITVNEYGLNVEQTIDKILSLRNEKKCKK